MINTKSYLCTSDGQYQNIINSQQYDTNSADIPLI